MPDRLSIERYTSESFERLLPASECKVGKMAKQIWPDKPNKALHKDVDARWATATVTCILVTRFAPAR